MATISDINLEARALVDADTTSYPAATLLRRINEAYQDVVAFIMNVDGKWQFDDSNYTDFPEGKTDLVDGQQDYSIADEHLEIIQVDVKNSSGNWQRIHPIDKSDYSEPLDEIFETDSLPQYYDKDGRSLLLYPSPSSGSVTLSQGLRVSYNRGADIFTSAEVTTGTKEPGFATLFHYVLAYKAALPYAQSYKKDRVPFLLNRIADYEEKMLKFYTHRSEDERKVLSTRGTSFK